MSFAHKVVLWVMQRRGYLVRLNKRQNFFHTLLFVGNVSRGAGTREPLRTSAWEAILLEEGIL